MDNFAPWCIVAGMKTDFDIVIVGGGLNGPALALALAQGGANVAVVDVRPAPARAERGFDGRAYAIAAGSQRLLAALGVWPSLAPHAQPILQIKTSDGAVGRGPAAFFMSFDHGMDRSLLLEMTKDDLNYVLHYTHEDRDGWCEPITEHQSDVLARIFFLDVSELCPFHR
jgi:2-octaprenyl-6-methoxyphenol hydroxylase